MIVQARSSSQRLPGKVLLEIAGRPLLAYTIERLRQCRTVREVAIATSTQPEDDRIAMLGEDLGVHVHRGPLDDVLARFCAAARAFNATAVVRISGDSPLIDPEIVDRVVEVFLSAPCDLASNVFPRTFPKGQSVEVATVAALERIAIATADPEDREHATRYFYAHPEAFAIRNLACDRDLSEIQLSVDTPDDFALVARMISSMKQPHWHYGLNELLSLRKSAGLAAVG